MRVMMILHSHCLLQPLTIHTKPSNTEIQPFVWLGDVSPFIDLMDGKNLLFLLAKKAGNLSTKYCHPVSLVLDTV